VVAGTLPPPICGTTVSLQLLIGELRKIPDVEPTIVNTGNIRGQGMQTPWLFLRLLVTLLRATWGSDVLTLHLSPLAIPLLGPFAIAIARISGKPIVLRLFGGQDFRDFPGIGGRIQRWVSRQCDVYLVQTGRLMRSGEEAGIQNLDWYPTSRPNPTLPPVSNREKKRCCRFVFIGWVKESKGVPLILDAASNLSEDIVIDVYGPFDGMSPEDFDGLSNVRYRGIIPAGDAIQTLHGYDALLLPTHWEGEGYPGVILEAYLAGIPVIATRWRDIPEIVDDECGILIEPRSSHELARSIQMLHDTPAEYQRLSAGAAKQGKKFEGSRWARKLVEICRSQIGPAGPVG